MSILTYKILHRKDFTGELFKAKQVAEYALSNKNSNSSKDVKQYGLPSTISNQILRKYGRNKKARIARSVKLTIPGQSVKQDLQGYLRIPCLKLQLPFNRKVTKINQIEIGPKYAYVSCTVQNEKEFKPASYLGVDLNTTGYAIVLADPTTGKVRKFNKSERHYRRKYGELAAKAQRKKNYKLAKKHRAKEARKLKDLNHKASREIITQAHKEKKGIRLEKLTGIRDNLNKKTNKTNRKTVNNWSFYQFQQMIIYKAKLLGIPVEHVNPEYTSQECSKCGKLGERNGKQFKCSNCGHYENADTNAAFNIANRSLDYKPRKHSHSIKQRTLIEGSTDLPRSNTIKARNSKPSNVQAANARTPLL